MNYSEYSKKIFDEICAAIPANCCDVKETENGRILDLGDKVQGGWTSVKLMLDALIGGRGIVNVSRDFRGMHQFPALELFYDDPVGAWQQVYSNEPAGIIEEDGSYAFAVQPSPDVKVKGNVAVTGDASLAYAAFDAAYALPDAVKLLLEEGVAPEDIQWAWSFAPIAVLSKDPEVLKKNAAEARERRVVSIWLRCDDEKLAEIVGKYEAGTLRLHNLVTARTIMVEGPAKRINC